MKSALFRFNAERHEYLDPETGELYPHITGMLKRAGLVDDTWFTEEHSNRGRAVHDLTAQYDLGALPVEECASKYRGYLLAHVKAMSIIKPAWEMVEVPLVHPKFRFGGRPDRAGLMYQCQSVCEVKSGVEDDDVHGVQTALQAILVAPTFTLPPEAVQRFVLYLRDDGKFKLNHIKAPRDFRRAYEIIKECRT